MGCRLKEDVERISWLAAHHHTYTDVDGLDHRILLEADYIVNAAGKRFSPQLNRERKENRFQNRIRNTPARLHIL